MKRLLLIIALLLSGWAVRAQEGDLAARLEAANAFRTLSVHFTMIRRSTLLAQPVCSSGVLLIAAPDRLRWEVREPRSQLFIRNGNAIRTPEGKVLSLDTAPGLSRIPEITDKLFDGQSFTMTFEATSQGWKIRLVPRRRDLRKLFSELYVYTEDLLIQAVEWFDPAGDSTLLEFSDRTVDATLQPACFDVGA